LCSYPPPPPPTSPTSCTKILSNPPTPLYTIPHLIDDN